MSYRLDTVPSPNPIYRQPGMTLELHEPKADFPSFSVEEVAWLTLLPRRPIVPDYPYGSGAAVAAPETGGWTSKDEGSRSLRRLTDMRQTYRVNLRTQRLVVELRNEIKHLQQEMRYRRPL